MRALTPPPRTRRRARRSPTTTTYASTTSWTTSRPTGRRSSLTASRCACVSRVYLAPTWSTVVATYNCTDVIVLLYLFSYSITGIGATSSSWRRWSISTSFSSISRSATRASAFWTRCVYNVLYLNEVEQHTRRLINESFMVRWLGLSW